MESKQVVEGLQEQARVKQSAATSLANSAIPLRKVDEVGAASWWKRMFRLVAFGVLPLVAALYFVFSWAFRCSPTPAVALVAPTMPAAAVAAPTVKLVGSLFDQTMGKAPSLPGLYSAPGVPG